MRLWFLDKNFKDKKHRIFPLNLYSLKSLNGIDKGGVDGIIVNSMEGDFLLDANLKVKASFPNMRCVRVVHRGENLAPHIILRDKNHFKLGQLVKNRFYPVTRYYSIVVTLLIAGSILFLTIFSNRLYWRCQTLHALQALVIETDGRGLLLFNRSQKILMMNTSLRRWLGNSDKAPNHSRCLAKEFAQFPEILAFIQNTLDQPARQYEKNILLTHRTNQRKIRIIIEPLPIGNRKKISRLATFIDRSIDDEIVQAKTWCKMAQKTAHDVKNPLTTIRLTLERLEMFKPELSPPAAEKFDLYVKRIIERAESLRTLHVPSQLATIQAAIEAASDADAVRLARGFYNISASILNDRVNN